jgi:hypothetical protein
MLEPVVMLNSAADLVIRQVALSTFLQVRPTVQLDQFALLVAWPSDLVVVPVVTFKS